MNFNVLFFTALFAIGLTPNKAHAEESASGSSTTLSTSQSAVPFSGPTAAPVDFPIGVPSLAAKSPKTSTSPMSESGLTISYLTSRTTQEMSYQTMKSLSGGGDSGGGGGGGDGGGGGGSTLPNLNYVSAAAFMPLSQRGTVAFTGMQSLDSVNQLHIATPFGADFQLPSEVALVRYRYEISPMWAVDTRGFYIDTVGFRDPSLGATYTTLNPNGPNGPNRWTQMFSLSTSAPVTSSSQNDNLLTRTSLRTSFIRRVQRLAFNIGLSHVHTFYEGGSPPNRERGNGSPNKVRQTDAGDDGKPTIPIYPSDVDLILIQREIHRTRTDVGFAYAVTDRFSLGMGAGLSYSITEKEKTLWMTSAKALVAKLTLGAADIATDVSLNSDIRDYDAPRLPSFLTIGVRVGYTFGAKPTFN